MKRFLLFTLVIGLFAVQANAGMMLKISDGINPTLTIGDNDLLNPGDIDPTVGVVTYIGSFGIWQINVTSGTSKPVIGGPAKANLDLLSGLVSSGGAGSLTLELTDTDYLLPAVWTNVTMISELSATTDGTIQLDQSYDPDNSEFAVTTPGNDLLLSSPSLGPGAVSDTQTGSALLVNPFSLTEKVVVTHSAVGDFTSFDVESTVIPVPGAVLLGMLGLSVAGIKLRRFA